VRPSAQRRLLALRGGRGILFGGGAALHAEGFAAAHALGFGVVHDEAEADEKSKQADQDAFHGRSR